MGYASTSCVKMPRLVKRRGLFVGGEVPAPPKDRGPVSAGYGSTCLMIIRFINGDMVGGISKLVQERWGSRINSVILVKSEALTNQENALV